MMSRLWMSAAAVLLAVSTAWAAPDEGRRPGRQGRGIDQRDRPAAEDRPAADRPGSGRGGRLFEALDANGNGQIDRDEFFDRLPRVVEQMHRPDARQPSEEPTPPPPPADELERRLNEIVERRLREFTKGHLPELVERKMEEMGKERLPGPLRDTLRHGLRQRQRDRRGDRPWASGSWRRGPGQKLGGPMADRWCQYGPRRGWGRQHRRTDEPGKGAQAFTPPDRQQRGRALGKRDQDRGKLKQDWQRRRAAGPGAGGAMLFGRLDANHDKKLQPQELKRTIDILNKALRESDGKDITPDQWNRIAQELRHRPHRPRQPAPKKPPDKTDRPATKKKPASAK